MATTKKTTKESSNQAHENMSDFATKASKATKEGAESFQTLTNQTMQTMFNCAEITMKTAENVAKDYIGFAGNQADDNIFLAQETLNCKTYHDAVELAEKFYEANVAGASSQFVNFVSDMMELGNKINQQFTVLATNNTSYVMAKTKENA